MTVKPDNRQDKNISPLLVILSLFLLTGIFAAVMNTYITSSSAYIDDFSRDYLREMLALVEKSCKDMIDGNYQMAENVSRYLCGSAGDKEFVPEDYSVYFDATKESRNLEEILLLNHSGQYLSAEGKKGRIDMDGGFNSLFTDRQRVAHYVVWDNNEMKFAFAVPTQAPLQTEDLAYEAVVLLYDTETLTEMINISSFEGAATLYMLDQNGIVMFGNSPDTPVTGINTNLFAQYVENGYMTGGEKDAVLSDFAAGHSGTKLVKKEADSYLSYRKMADVPLYLVFEVEVAKAQTAMVNYQESTNRNAFAISALLFLMMMIVAWYFWRSKSLEMIEEAENARILQENNLALQRANREIQMANEEIQTASEVLERRNRELELTRQMSEDALRIAEEANRSKSNFLSNMSHDIRTPMNAIVGFAALLSRDAENPEKVREYTKKITSSSQHLLGLINDVLDMSKIEAGKTTLNLSEAHIGEVIEGIDLIVRPQMKAKKHTFHVVVKDVKHEAVMLDKLRINQILLNLLSNAEKYTPEGGNITLTLQELPQRSGQFARYRFMVEDNGIGMSEEFSKTIFEAFTREENSATNRIQGTGLGMAITKNLVTLMGGKISVASCKEGGTTFTVDLELRLSEQDVDNEYWREHGITKLLVVDDEEVICQHVAMAMEGTGVRVDYTLDGGSAVDMVKRSDEENTLYNVVLLDWKMPGMDGVETARRIRQEIPREVPLLVLTSYDWTEIEEEARMAGIDAFLPKPFFVTGFRNKMDTLLKREDAGEEPEARAEESSGILEGKHILVAEDNEINAEILSELLGMAGADCEIFENGALAKEAFEQSAPRRYDLILMDVQMPVMNGYEATRAIRDCAHPLALTIPIIAMTANAFAEDINNALESGMNAHVAKPVDMTVLEETIRNVLELRKND